MGDICIKGNIRYSREETIDHYRFWDQEVTAFISKPIGDLTT